MYKSSLQAILTVSCILFLFGLVLPELIVLLLFLNLILLIGNQLNKWLQFNKQPLLNPSSSKPSSQPRPFISIHIPVCDEPVEQVRQTILSAHFQDYDRYEVIVLYNNTTNKSLVEPIRKLTKNLSGVRFFEKDGVKGYKAGALNLCLQLMHPRTDYIFTVDADYRLDRNALIIAAEELAKNSADLLQFPQAYSNHGTKNGLADELDHYFRYYAQNASIQNLNLPTGTLSLIKKGCLEKIGGWPTESITEDAYLGTQLISNHCHLSYSNRIVGRGLMPATSADLKTQRMRWIFGNFQTLMATLQNRSMNLKIKLSASAQLTSWINFLGIPMLALILSSLASLFIASRIYSMIGVVSMLTFGIYAIIKLVTLRRAGFKRGRLLRVTITHLATAVESAFVWWGYFIDKDRPFSRTNKFQTPAGMDIEAWLVISILFLFATFHASKGNLWWAAGLFTCSMVYMISRISLLISFRDTRKHKLSVHSQNLHAA